MHSRRSRRVKIIATLGPASADRETVAALFAAGADVFRINMSHASHDAMRERVARIRALEEETGRPIGVLVDLQGPKLWLGLFADGGAELHKGDVFVLDSDPAPGDAGRVQLPHPEILSSLAPGHRIGVLTKPSRCRSASANLPIFWRCPRFLPSSLWISSRLRASRAHVGSRRGGHRAVAEMQYYICATKRRRPEAGDRTQNFLSYQDFIKQGPLGRRNGKRLAATLRTSAFVAKRWVTKRCLRRQFDLAVGIKMLRSHKRATYRNDMNVPSRQRCRGKDYSCLHPVPVP